MNNRLFLSLTTWPFVLSLVVLLLNDWWFKSAYPNIVTGKLSDFSGIAIVALLSLSIWPKRTRTVYLGISAFFLWWKSPLSNSAIEFFNLLAPFAIGRTVDYTDLLALIVLPICGHIAVHTTAFAISGPTLRRMLLAPIAATTIFAIMGTSALPVRQDYVVRRTESADALRRDAISEIIGQVAEQHGLKKNCALCAVHSDGAEYGESGLKMTYKFLNSDAVSFNIEEGSVCFFFCKTAQEKIDALTSALKLRLKDRFKGLEYVEPLKNVEWPRIDKNRP